MNGHKVPSVVLGLALLLSVGCQQDATEPVDASAVPPESAISDTNSVSTFNTHSDGWTLVGDAEGALGLVRIGFAGIFRLQASHSPTEGNPDGAIFAIDEEKGLVWYFQAPPKFLGNRLRNFGGTLEFDLKISGNTANIFSAIDVIMAGGGLTLLIQTSPAPGTDWTHYSVGLDEGAGWKIEDVLSVPDATRGEIRQVLTNLVVLRIRGEHIDGPDTGFLDNVRMAPPPPL